MTHPPGSDLLDALLASLGDAVYLVDAEGRVRFANPAAVALLGYDREDELLGAPSHATIHHTRPDGTPFPEEECPLLRPRATGETVRVDHDWFVRRDGGLVPVAYSSAPVHVDGGRGAVVAFRDISEALRAQAERVRAAELHASRARIVAAADAERRRLGRDLHDGAQAAARQRRDRAAARRAAQRRRRPGRRRARRAAHRDGRAARPRLRAAALRPHEPRPGRGGRDADRQGPAAGGRVRARRPLRRDRRGRRVLRRRRGARQRRQARRGHGGVGRGRARRRRARRGDPRRRPRRRRPGGGQRPARARGSRRRARRRAGGGSPAGGGTRVRARLPLATTRAAA